MRNPTKKLWLDSIKIGIEVFGYASLPVDEATRLSIDAPALALKNKWGYVAGLMNHVFSKDRPHLTFGEKPNKKDLKRIKKMRAHN